MTLLTDAIKAMVGTERTYVAPEPFGTAAGRYFALAIEDHNPMYAAREIAPLTLICDTNQYANLPMNEFHQYVHATDVLHVTWKIDEISERVNSKGIAMATMFSTATYRNQRNELLATNTESLIWIALEAN